MNIKKISIIILFFVINNVCFSQDLQADQTEILTNDAIVNMVNSKIPKKIILSKIGSTNANFDLTSSAIIKLNENKINDELILKMMESDKNRMVDSEILTNEVIIKMASAKISKKIILSKIKTSNNNFDLKSDALIKLTENKISEDVVMAIMDAKNKQVVEMAKPEIKKIPKKFNKPTDLSKISNPGIYYFDGNSNTFLKLDPNVFSAVKVSGGILNSAFSGMFKVKSKASLNGNNANFQFNDQEVSFYFYFSKKQNNGKDLELDLFETTESPNEYTLAKFKTYNDKNIREIEMGSSNADGASYGINQDQIISFKYEKISQNLYRIYFPKPLVNGEYCFMPTVNSSTQGKSSKMYDFSIKIE
jgi:hypothetical protein